MGDGRTADIKNRGLVVGRCKGRVRVALDTLLLYSISRRGLFVPTDKNARERMIYLDGFRTFG